VAKAPDGATRVAVRMHGASRDAAVLTFDRRPQRPFQPRAGLLSMNLVPLGTSDLPRIDPAG